MKKTFQTGRLNALKKQERLSWLLFPGIMLAVFLLFGPDFLLNDSGGHYLQGLFRFIVLDSFIAAVFGIVPFYFIQARIRGAKKEALRNASFVTVQNIDYYREKLRGLTPGEISLLEDLKLETDKDIAACSLRYELLGLIRKNSAGDYAQIESDSPNVSRLRKSDQYLLNHLAAGSPKVNLERWQNLTIVEAKEDGLIEDKPFTNKTPEQIKQSNICFLAAWFLCLCLCLLPVIPGMLRDYCDKYSSGSYAPSQRLKTCEAILDALPDWAFFFSDLEDELNDIYEDAKWNHSASFYEKQNYLFSTNYFGKLALRALIEMLILLVFLLPFLYLKMGMARMKERAAFRRTALGNELAEYIWGMKNFIHDFSNLNEATKTALALWDDYLIYAVVLEENKKIVEEIKMTRRNSL